MREPNPHLMCIDICAGLEGIEPPIAVLETAVMPFNYSPTSLIISKIVLVIDFLNSDGWSHSIFKIIYLFLKTNHLFPDAPKSAELGENPAGFLPSILIRLFSLAHCFIF